MSFLGGPYAWAFIALMVTLTVVKIRSEVRETKRRAKLTPEQREAEDRAAREEAAWRERISPPHDCATCRDRTCQICHKYEGVWL